MSGRLGRTVFVLLVFSVVVAGCILDGPSDNPRISNRSESAVEIRLVNPGVDDAPLVTIAGGQDYEVVMYAGSCLPYPMVAVTEVGTTIDHHEPLCPGDLWVIDPPT